LLPARLPAKRNSFRDDLRARGVSVEIPQLDEGDFERLTITGQLSVIERAAAGGSRAANRVQHGGYLAALYAARHPEVPRVVLPRARLRPGAAMAWVARPGTHGRVAPARHHAGLPSR